MQEPNKYALFLRDLAQLLKERALEARRERDSRRTDFDAGRSLAYYEVLSTTMNEAETFQIPPEDLGLEGFDPDKELL